MAKRSPSKPSRHERKQRRVKSARATDHGLPSALPRTRPSRPDPGADSADVGPPSSDSGDLAEGSERRGRSLSQRIHDVSLPVKIAIVAAVALAVIWVFAFTGGRDASRPAPASSVSAQPTTSALPVVSTPPAAAPAPTVSRAPPAVPTLRATAPRKTAEPAPEQEPPVPPTVSASASASTVKPANDIPPRATERPGPPTSLSGAAKALEPPPFVTPPPPAPPLPSTHPEPDPLKERTGRPDVGDP